MCSGMGGTTTRRHDDTNQPTSLASPSSIHVGKVPQKVDMSQGSVSAWTRAKAMLPQDRTGCACAPTYVFACADAGAYHELLDRVCACVCKYILRIPYCTCIVTWHGMAWLGKVTGYCGGVVVCRRPGCEGDGHGSASGIWRLLARQASKLG